MTFWFKFPLPHKTLWILEESIFDRRTKTLGNFAVFIPFLVTKQKIMKKLANTAFSEISASSNKGIQTACTNKVI